MNKDDSAPLIFNAWLRELIRTIAADELGPHFRRYWYIRPHFIRLVLLEKNIWCDTLKQHLELKRAAKLSGRLLRLQ